MEQLDALQRWLSWDSCDCARHNPLFRDNRGHGRMAVAGFVLGGLWGLHLVLLFVGAASARAWLVRWGLYMASLAFFHFTEYLTTAIYKPETAAYDSFVISHSKEYTAAALASWIEFWVELLLFPGLKSAGSGLTLLVGATLLLGGQACRVVAMHTAKAHFSHQIMERKAEGHQLVTHGIYRHLRHPSYFGWFWWSVGTQVVLCNPLCLVAYALVSWRFFDGRIRYEERTLCEFYPSQYPAYRERTYVGIPFIR